MRALEQLRLPVAVDGDGDDEQHWHDDGGDDNVERQIVLLLVLHRAHHPLAFAKLDLYTGAEWKREGEDPHVQPVQVPCPTDSWVNSYAARSRT